MYEHLLATAAAMAAGGVSREQNATSVDGSNHTLAANRCDEFLFNVKIIAFSCLQIQDRTKNHHFRNIFFCSIRNEIQSLLKCETIKKQRGKSFVNQSHH